MIKVHSWTYNYYIFSKGIASFKQLPAADNYITAKAENHLNHLEQSSLHIQY